MDSTSVVACIFLSVFTFRADGVQPNCANQQTNIDVIIKNNRALDLVNLFCNHFEFFQFYFMNDTKETVQLTWAGENSGVILITEVHLSGSYTRYNDRR